MGISGKKHWATLGLALMVAAPAAKLFANEYYEANFSCRLSATREAIRTKKSKLPKEIPFSYWASFYYDHTAGQAGWKIAKLELTSRERILELVLAPEVAKVDPSFGGERAYPLLKVTSNNKHDIVSLLSLFGESGLKDSDAFSCLLPIYKVTFERKENSYQDYTPDSSSRRLFELSWGGRSQSHFPVTDRDGLSYHVRVECKGNCGDGGPSDEVTCPYW